MAFYVSSIIALVSLISTIIISCKTQRIIIKDIDVKFLDKLKKLYKERNKDG